MRMVEENRTGRAATTEQVALEEKLHILAVTVRCEDDKEKERKKTGDGERGLSHGMAPFRYYRRASNRSVERVNA